MVIDTKQPAYEAADLLEGAAQIALFMYGDRSKVRKIFYLARNTRFPHFRIGSRICALRSELADWVQTQIEQSRRGAQPQSPERSFRTGVPRVPRQRR